MEKFSNLIRKASLLDARFKGSKFTLINNIHGLYRFDMILINPPFTTSFLEVEVRHLINMILDHKTLLVKPTSSINFSLKCITFRKIWHLHKNLLNLSIIIAF